MRFYMGTFWMFRRADLTIVYAMICRCLKVAGADFVYNFPCTTSPKSGSSSSHARTTCTKAAATYSVSQAAVAALEAQKRRADVEQFLAELRGECARATRRWTGHRVRPFARTGTCTAAIMRLAAGMKTGAHDAVGSRMYEVSQFRTARASK